MEKVLAVVALSFGKKATIYAIGRTYGFPRLYRRFVEFSRRTTCSKDSLKNRADVMKWTFRAPNRLFGWFRRFKGPAVT